MNKFNILIIIWPALLSIIKAQCIINSDCFCLVKSNIISLTCGKTIKNSSEFINLKFNLNLTNVEYEISIKDKNYTVLPDFIFRGIKIQILDMQYNEIEYFSNWTFSDIIKLNKLILDNNKIKSIENLIGSLSVNTLKPTQINPSISLLSLINNRINQIITKFTKAFGKLTEIYLNKNLISLIRANVFENLKDLATLNLENNLLESVSNGSLFGPSKYTTLLLGFNKIVKLEALFAQNITFVLPKVDFRFFLYHSNIQEIENFAFNFSFSLKNLDLSDNKITKIKSNSLLGLKNLDILDLRINKISTIEANGFDHLTSLTELYLEENELSLIDNKMFYFNSNLKVLTLKNNKINLIENNSFINLKKLNSLDLSYNFLYKIDSASLNGLISLYQLGIEGNPIEKIDPFSFKNLISMIELNFNYLDISYLEPNTFLGLTNLDTLHLNFNHLTFINRNTFNGLDSLMGLNIKSNIISFIEEGAFSNLTKLFFIDLTYNFVSKINLNLFSPENKIKNLFLGFNKLEIIKDYCFSTLIYLEKLFLNNNLIKAIEQNSFKNLKKLKVLDISFNKLEIIKSNDFEGLASLEYLSLTYNNIYTIEVNSIHTLASLKELYLDQNYLEKLDDNIFMNMSCLKTLNLADNYLQLSKYMFKNAKILISLNLSRNEMDNFSLNMLAPTVEMTKLDFSFNMLKYFNIENNSNLTNYPKIVELDLSNNFFERINVSFEIFQSLETLNFSFNLIEYVYESDLRYLKKLKTLVLDNNKIRCYDKYAFFRSNIQNLYLSQAFEQLDANNFIDFLNSNTISLSLSHNVVKEDDSKSFNYSFPNLKLVSLANSSLTSFYYFKYNLFPNLEVLDLSFNRLNLTNILLSNLTKLNKLTLSNIDLETIDSLNLDNFILLAHLNLSFNNLKIIKSTYFYSNQKLALLDLSNNELESIEANTFLYLKELNFLYLNNNKLKFFLLNDFNSNSGLQTLLLNNNQLAYLRRITNDGKKTDPNQGFSFLVNLNLSGNNIDEFDSNFLTINQFIKIICLDNNKIKNISKYSFNFLNNIELLQLDKNEIEIIHDSTFKIMILLRTLTLNFNKINYLEPYAFNGLFRLNYLNLSNNYISFIESTHFEDLYSLITLDLSYNNLKFIQNYSFVNLNYLLNLHLSGNSNFSIGQYSFEGLIEIKNVYIEMELFMNKTFVMHFRHSIYKNASKHVLDWDYYESINLISASHSLPNLDECRIIVDSIKFFYLFNLFDEQQVDYFLDRCQILFLNRK